MSLNKAIEHHKEHRKPYKGAKAIDKHCRNNGNCDWCKGNRTYSNKKRKQKYNDELILPRKLRIAIAKDIKETIERGYNEWKKNQQKKKR